MSKSILEKIENNITDKVEKIMLISLSVLLGVFALLFVVRSCLLYGGDGDKRAILKKQMSSLTEVHEFTPKPFGEKNTFRRMVIGQNGSATEYRYVLLDGKYIPRTVSHYVGGGCRNGEVPFPIKLENISTDSLLFFGKRSFGSLTESECNLVFQKLALDLVKSQSEVNSAILQNLGIRLLYSSGACMGDRLSRRGYDTESVKIVDYAVGVKALKTDPRFGDLYGWYVLEVDRNDGIGTDRMEGFLVLHSREYGFSAENYLLERTK